MAELTASLSALEYMQWGHFFEHEAKAANATPADEQARAFWGPDLTQ